MKRIIIFGTGKGAQKVFGFLNLSACNILGVLDNHAEQCNRNYFGCQVKKFHRDLPKYDYIIISTIKAQYIDEIYKQLSDAGIAEEKIIAFFDENRIKDFAVYQEFIDISAWQIFLLNRKIRFLQSAVSNLDNKYSMLLSGMDNRKKEKGEKEEKEEKEGKKVRLYIFGTGRGAKELAGYLHISRCEILGFIDNDKRKYGKTYDGKPVIPLQSIQMAYDFILISTKILESTRSIMLQIEEKNIDMNKVIPFFDIEKVVIKNEYASFVNLDLWRGALLNREIQNYERSYRIRIENMKYEILDEVRSEKIRLPRIVPVSRTLKLIIEKGCSIVRFGDGEFGLIDKCRFHKFQKDDDRLAKRLEEVLYSHEPGCLVAIADNYGSLEQMTERGKDSIRIYMTSGAREIHMGLLDLTREYHNAYLTRPYIYFKDKEHAGERFDALKKIWEDRDIVIIEGHQTRLGVGNDLIAHAKSVRRILGPVTNAFDSYEKIMEAALKIEKTALFLLALGPTATVLAYDLYKSGYQAVDIGHIDVEYEWFQMGAEYPVKLENKYVCEVIDGDEVKEMEDETYLQQIIDRIYE